MLNVKCEENRKCETEKNVESVGGRWYAKSFRSDFFLNDMLPGRFLKNVDYYLLSVGEILRCGCVPILQVVVRAPGWTKIKIEEGQVDFRVYFQHNDITQCSAKSGHK